MRISDWSSDVCSSDLGRLDQLVVGLAAVFQQHEGAADLDRGGAGKRRGDGDVADTGDRFCRRGDRVRRAMIHLGMIHGHLDRKSVVLGKSVSVRVALGGRRNLKKKTKIYIDNH